MRKIKNLFHQFFAFFAALYYRFPGKKMIVIGITGTSGKTTTTHLLYEILKSAGKKVSMVSTIEAIINDKSYDTGFHVTTPSSWQIQKFMHKAAKNKSQYFILEVTSHGLDQHRVYGTSIDIAVVTNIAHEHLDYHGCINSYRAAKRKIFEGAEYAVINKDDDSFHYLSKKAGAKIAAFAIDKPADYQLSDFKFRPRIQGKYNLYNCLASAAVAMILEIDKKTIEKAVAGFSGIKGRMEEIKTDRPFRIFIDFAHKPDALREVLKTVRTITKNKLIVIFGCAGYRDRLKRPIMGEIAAKLADYIILTAEDPRGEDVRDIIKQIAPGCVKVNIREANKKEKMPDFVKNKQKYFWRIPDRQEAINYAIRNLANRGDMILICGKGHEQSMCYGDKEFPWDERRAVKKALL